jgi:transposase InsO family protein
MRANRERYTVREMAGFLGVSSSAYYRWAKYGVSGNRKEADAELVRLIREIMIRHHSRYGSPRVREELRHDHGKRVSRKKAARLMRENGLYAKRRRQFIVTTDSRHGLPVCDNLLNREFHAEEAGTKWVSDSTYLRTISGWVFLTVVPELFDRKIIGWALSADMETVHTTIPALEMVFANRKAQEGLLFHSDRGVQYCAQSFRNRLKELCPSVRQTMSRKGNCGDNA